VDWRNDGPVDNDELVAALREHLTPAPLPESIAIAPTVGPGQAAPDFYLDSAGIIHLRRLQGRPVVLCFVQPLAESSIARARRLERLASRQAENDARVVFVIDGVDQSGAEAFARSHSLSAVVVADPLGAVAERFDVRIWPATFRVDEHGIITGYEAGADPGSMAMRARD
jgi:peroxiredoxin